MAQHVKLLGILHIVFGALGVFICLFVALYFEVFLLISYLERKPTGKTSAKPSLPNRRRFPLIFLLALLSAR